VRDRAGPDADGARAGAPSAVQVADRFHLVRRASPAVEELRRARRRALEAALTPAATAPAADAAAPPVLSATARHDAERRAARVARWEKVHALRAEGWGIMRIAKEMGMIARTVNGLLASPVPPRNRQFQTRPAPLASPTLAPFAEYLRDRWAAGERNVNQLVREIVARGYTGSTSLVRQATSGWRPPRPRPRPAAREGRGFNVRWLCLRPPDTLRDDEEDALARLLAAHADLATGHRLLQRFRRLVAQRDPTALDAWLADARDSGLAPFQALANGLVGDRAAVEAALTTPWSTGPVEGHIHRVKSVSQDDPARTVVDGARPGRSTTNGCSTMPTGYGVSRGQRRAVRRHPMGSVSACQGYPGRACVRCPSRPVLPASQDHRCLRSQPGPLPGLVRGCVHAAMGRGRRGRSPRLPR